MIHFFPEYYHFEEPSEFTDPFRYAPHPAVRFAADLVMQHISASGLAADFSEGKMLGVLVCRTPESNPCYIAAFSGNVGGRSIIEGFVPPVYDLMNPIGEFKRREAEISELNIQIESLLDSDRMLCLERELADAERGCKIEIDAMKESMAVSRSRREHIRTNCTDPKVLEGLIKESQYENAELRRLKKALDKVLSDIQGRIREFNSQIDSLRRKRASMSESLQDWIFRQYIVHDFCGNESSISEIFAGQGLVPPGGTGECAAPKLLEYAFRNGLTPMAMGEFWYGKSPDTAVRTHGHFYPSCTSKCGPLLGFMLNGLSSPQKGRIICMKSPVIIFEDKDIIIVEKPSGMPSVPGLDGRISLLEWLQSHLSGARPVPHENKENIQPVHRLDMDTSGVMIFARNNETAVNLRRQFEEHTVRKTYMARVSVSGTLEPKSGRINLPLSPDYDERPRQKVDVRQGKTAYTEYQVISKNPDGTADLMLHPHTGRTHQLRVHCAHTLGLCAPIIGDLLYGGAPAQRLHLHALSITFTHPSTGETKTFSSRQLCYNDIQSEK